MKRFFIWFGVIFALSLIVLILTLHVVGYDAVSLMLQDKSYLWMVIFCLGVSMMLGSLSFVVSDDE